MVGRTERREGGRGKEVEKQEGGQSEREKGRKDGWREGKKETEVINYLEINGKSTADENLWDVSQSNNMRKIPKLFCSFSNSRE